VEILLPNGAENAKKIPDVKFNKNLQKSKLSEKARIIVFLHGTA